MEGTFRREIASLDVLFEFVERFGEAHGLDEHALFAVKIAVEEIFTNLVRHNTGGADHIAVDLEAGGGRLRIRLTDYDVDPVSIGAGASVDVRAPLAEREPGGLGVHLVRRLMDDLVYEYENRTLQVTATKRLEDSHV